MPTPRRPLGQISSNITNRKELNPSVRGDIKGRTACGQNPPTIARALNIPVSTVRDTVQKVVLRNNNYSLPRSGRPLSYSKLDLRNILRFVRTQPKATYAQLKGDTGVKISTTTIKTILKEHGIENWRAKKRPFLTEDVVAQRLTWCIKRKDWTIEDFINHMWSDECSAERGKGRSQEWCFRTPAQKWNKEMITTYKKSKDISVMVWGCFWWADGEVKRSDLYIMDRDFASKKNGYSARSYLEVLNARLPSCWSPGLIFMQDNAPIHKAGVVLDWFTEQGIPLTDWPPYSPDLNLIEHIWFHMKAQVLKLHPELTTMGNGEAAIQALERALIEAWQAVPSYIFEHLIASMPERVAACIKAKGWHTRY